MQKAKILVVDDDVKLARLVRTILERTGYYMSRKRRGHAPP